MEKENLTLDDFLSRFQLLRPQVSRETLNRRQAAVLIPVVRREQPGLLLTQRSPHLRKHAGQVAFPGGAVDSTDASLIAAARWLSHEPFAQEGAQPAVQRSVEHAARPLARYRCAACGFEARQHFWQCPGCQSWDSYPARRVEEL